MGSFGIFAILLSFKVLVIANAVKSNWIFGPGYGTDWIYMEGENNTVVKCYLRTSNNSRLFPDYNLNESVIFKLYTQRNTDGQIVTLEDNSLSKTHFDPKKMTKIIIHGWFSSGEAEISRKGKNSYLSKYDYNVFVVGWQTIAYNIIYPIPVLYTPKVGKHVGKFLMSILNAGSDRNSIHIIGHSLGAHIAGFASKSIPGEKIGRITGLDPALPGFDVDKPNERLEKGDAKFVDVIHTCMGTLGIVDAIGDADFYPNGGRSQPGCPLITIGESCSHSRSWKYFWESITIPFTAYACDTYEEFLLGKCRFGKSETALMGEKTPHNTKGVYYLETYPESPFSKIDLADNYVDY